MALKNLTQRQRLTERTELTEPVGDDLIHVVDVSDTADSTDGTSKKMKISAMPFAQSDDIDNLNRLFTSTASTLAGLATELNTKNPPLVISENEIYVFKLTNGDLYQMLNKGKGTYGVGGVTDLVFGDFLRVEKVENLLEFRQLIASNGSVISSDLNNITTSGLDIPMAAPNLTVQPNSTIPLPIGFRTFLHGGGVGKSGINLLAGEGVTIEKNTPFLFISSLEFATLIKIGTDTWILSKSDVENPPAKDNNTTTFDLSDDFIYTTISGIRTANSATSYNFTSAKDGKVNTRLINASTEPILTSATKISGSAFVANTDMYMVAMKMPDRVEYHFQTITP